MILTHQLEKPTAGLSTAWEPLGSLSTWPKKDSGPMRCLYCMLNTETAFPCIFVDAIADFLLLICDLDCEAPQTPTGATKRP